MKYSQLDAREFIFKILTNRNIQYKVYDFESGATMIDVRYENNFYVIQLEAESIGLSLINDKNPGFDTIPDKRFFKLEDFTEAFNKLLG
jgi:hypothetical protein